MKGEFFEFLIFRFRISARMLIFLLTVILNKQNIIYIIIIKVVTISSYVFMAEKKRKGSI